MQLHLTEIKLDAYPDAYRQIANAVKAAGVTEIGDVNWRHTQDRFKDKYGEVRAASLDLGIESRSARSLFVMELTREQLFDLHAKEKRLGNFIYSIKKLFRLAYESPQMNEERNNAVYAFNDDNRPEPVKFRGVSIPPYFPPDNEFDGMEYHHAWDMGVWHNREKFYMPAIKGKTSGKRVLADVE